MPRIAEPAAGRRLALVVATGSYADPTLAKLRAPGQDASDLAAVLEDAELGEFEVEMALDAPAELLRRRIARFCAQTGPADLVLVYLSCHGVLDDRGRLYYATADTDRALLSATAVSSAWLNEQLEDCRCRRQILVLDCCHSGAFAKGAKGDGDLGLRERFEGRGRVVLTGSRATEYSFEEHGRVVGDGTSSVFTSALVEGLRSGKADRDGDGMITVSELYDYAYEAVRKKETRQTPTLWTYGAEGDLLVAYSPRGVVVKPAPLPEDLISLLESPRSRVREGAVMELTDLVTGPDAGRALTARTQLERIAAEDVPSVAAAARATLDAFPVDVQPHSRRPSHPAPLSTVDPPSPANPRFPHSRNKIAIIAGAIAGIGVAVTVALLAGGGGSGAPSNGTVPIPLTGRPSGIAVDRGVTWVARSTHESVSWIDPSAAPKPIDVPPYPEKIVAGRGSVWVSVGKGTGLVRIDPDSHEAEKEVSFDLKDCGCTISELAIAKDALWVGSADGITKLDLSTGKRLEEPYHDDSGFEGVFAVGGDALWAVKNPSHKPPEVVRIELGSHKAKHIQHISLNTGETLSGIAYGLGRVWVADDGVKRNNVIPLEPDRNRFLTPIKIPFGIANDDIAVTGSAVLVWNTWGGILTRINTEKMQAEPIPKIHLYLTENLVNLEHSDLAVDGDFAWVTDPAYQLIYKVSTNPPSPS